MGTIKFPNFVAWAVGAAIVVGAALLLFGCGPHMPWRWWMH